MKNKSNMRWHPTMIEKQVCKGIQRSPGILYLNLPCSRTLYDYSHYMEHKLGVNRKVFEQLIQSARKKGCYETEHCAFIGILHHEIKIKSDLVYNKATGELIGYVRLDDVTNELMKLRTSIFHSKSDIPVALHLLVTMVRGITSDLRYPFLLHMLLKH